MGTVILIGVLADQYLAQRSRRAAAARGRTQANMTPQVQPPSTT
jgi:ribose transport system permease protein